MVMVKGSGIYYAFKSPYKDTSTRVYVCGYTDVAAFCESFRVLACLAGRVYYLCIFTGLEEKKMPQMQM